METTTAIRRLTALAQETRLAIYRLLVPAGEEGLSAGVIAERLGVSPATLSFHLKELERAGLLQARREGRSICYAADYDGMRDLLGFLAEDCCQGRPELCAPLSILAAGEKRR